MLSLLEFTYTFPRGTQETNRFPPFSGPGIGRPFITAEKVPKRRSSLTLCYLVRVLAAFPRWLLLRRSVYVILIELDA